MTCSDCRWWSDRARPPRPIEAVCLCPSGPFRDGWTRATDYCSRAEPGEPVDLDDGKSPT